MATVKFSSDLRAEIINAAKGKFQGAVHTAVNSAPKDWGDRLYDLAFDKYAEDMAKFPKGFFQEREEVEVRDLDMPKGEDIRVGLTFKFTSKKLFPFAYPKNFPWQKAGSYSEDVNIKYNVALEDFKNEVLAWKERVAKAQARQLEFTEAVKAVVAGYATLAPALKAWPPLWDLVPEATKNKHREIKEREAKTVNLGVDLDRATALAAFTKLRKDDK